MWKAQLFKSADVSMLCHNFGVSQYPHFYERIKKIYQMLQCPNMGSYIGEKGHRLFKNHELLYYPNQLKHFYGFNKWYANYKSLAKFGKYDG